ncbi:MAG: nucleotidyltransferase [Clostridium sp.]|nr:nucleotidyltransferase [Clostridium sp.]
MKITGIITEYNPFHLGHMHHLNNAKKDTDCDGVICIMSGNFVQRGMPALLDKWNRAKMAVLNGVDLVIELPLIHSISSAENFSEGAVKILDATNVVDYLYFGSEHGSVNDLDTISSTLLYEPKQFKDNIKFELDKGLPYHTARSIALKNTLTSIPCEDILKNSNNILGIEYIKALKKINSSIKPLTLQRLGSNYNDSSITSDYPSATSIRNALKNNEELDKLEKYLPKETFSLLSSLLKNDYKFTFEEDIFPFLRYKLLTEGENIHNVTDVKEGLDNKIIKEISNSVSLYDLIMKTKSKRYTYTRINRILTSFFIGLDKYDCKKIANSNTTYIRPLAFNSTGSKILKEIKNEGNIKIITKLPKNIDDDKLKLDILGTKAYSILNPSISPYDDYLKSPTFFK